MDSVGVLPIEILLKVFKKISEKDLKTARLVCKQWNDGALICCRQNVNLGVTLPLTLHLNKFQQENINYQCSSLNLFRRLSIVVVGDIETGLLQFQTNVAFFQDFGDKFGHKVKYLRANEDGNEYPTLQWIITAKLFPNLTTLVLKIIPGYPTCILVEPEITLPKLKRLSIVCTTTHGISKDEKELSQWLINSAPNVEHLNLITCLDLSKLTVLKSLCLKRILGADWFPTDVQEMVEQVGLTLTKLEIGHKCPRILTKTPWNLPILPRLNSLELNGCIAEQIGLCQANFYIFRFPLLTSLKFSNQINSHTKFNKSGKFLEMFMEEDIYQRLCAIKRIELIGIRRLEILGNLKKFSTLSRLTVELSSELDNTDQHTLWNNLWKNVQPLKIFHLTVIITFKYDFGVFLQVLGQKLPSFLNDNLQVLCVKNSRLRNDSSVTVELTRAEAECLMKLKDAKKFDLFLQDWIIPEKSRLLLNNIIQVHKLPVRFIVS